MRTHYFRYDGEKVEAEQVGRFCGQFLQDQYVYNHFFENLRDGVFLDIGAHDGMSLSNTLFFERFMNWTGLCIEPNPDVFQYLEKNRNCCLQAALFDKEQTIEFVKIKGYAQTLSGIADQYDKSYPDRINYEIGRHGGSKETIQLKTRVLNDVLDEYKFKKIDFMSLDTEGSELSILKGLDLKRFDIRVIAIENNFDSEEHREYMKSQGYVFKDRLVIDDIFYKP